MPLGGPAGVVARAAPEEIMPAAQSLRVRSTRHIPVPAGARQR